MRRPIFGQGGPVLARIRWTSALPALAVLILVATWGRDLPGGVVALVAVFLAGAVLAAVYHAEVVAHRVGEPYGSLVLAVAVTVIEVALIVTLMVSGGPIDRPPGAARLRRPGLTAVRAGRPAPVTG